LILLVLGGFVALGAGLRSAQDAQQRRQEVQQFASQVDAAFARSGIVQQIGPTPVPIPEIQSAIADLERRKLDPQRLRADAARWGEGASELSDSIAALGAESPALREARDLMRQSLRLYASIAQEIRVAATLDPGERSELVGPLQQQMQLAGSFFDFGWRSLATERELAGIPVVEEPLAPPGFQAP
ncbi:MAG TPA: hypothetical protein VG709_08410, partial [Actinomycetota bacterium]|nr:hypothetical protein [Actinomycetota bacterium]